MSARLDKDISRTAIKKIDNLALRTRLCYVYRVITNTTVGRRGRAGEVLDPGPISYHKKVTYITGVGGEGGLEGV